MNDYIISALEEMEQRVRSAQPLSFSGLNPEETLLVSVDMNNGFAKQGALFSERVKALIPKTAALAAACEEHGVVLVAVSDHHNEQSIELNGGYPPHCLEGTDEPSLVSELQAFFPTVIEKNSTNAFYKMSTKELLSDYKNFIITGCCTDICIFQLACALKTYFNEQNDLRDIIVPVSLVDTYDSPQHPAQMMNTVFLCSMMDNGIRVVSDILY
ncbi:cysteine hydrolase family protein [Acetanaerobacterium elongatum]|uniref:Nicotinamidase-related amidase n=1 Tax=Acetanaerobacterium elongatum TaxID=258515 RepID=A0A1H0B0M5_9FIRM|nr:isochorismatase family cysteine hydrolase [Acetanaerobacterium elongatum]SDN39146.1 Nicotinamidase-related amidase [Acetanaerobacterium elongatum]